MYEQILVGREGRVGVIHLNRPEKRNSLSADLARELLAALTELDADPAVGAIIISGRGRDFCAGGDVADFARLATEKAPAVYGQGRETTRLFKMGGQSAKPLIAGVNGHALGGGLGLVAMCHLAVAADDARFGTPEIKLGFFPFVILPLMMRALGPRRALELALTGRTLDAAEALELGLVNRVVPAASLDTEVGRLAEEVAGHSPLALRLGLAAYQTAQDMEMARAMDCLDTLRVIGFLSEDLREGARAFLEKREARWTGR